MERDYKDAMKRRHEMLRKQETPRTTDWMLEYIERWKKEQAANAHADKMHKKKEKRRG